MNVKPNDWRYSFEEFDNFRDITHLCSMIVAKVEKFIRGAKAYLFVYNNTAKEYRQYSKETAISITEDSPLITYLAIKNRLINRITLENEPFFKEDSSARFIIYDRLKITVLLPFVYRFRLLAFLGMSFEEHHKLDKEERDFLSKLREEAIHNLYAALIVDTRFSELIGLASVVKDITSIERSRDIYSNLIKDMDRIIFFDVGKLMLIEGDELITKEVWSKAKHEKVLSKIKLGNSISGQVAKFGKPLVIADLEKNLMLKEKNKEKELKGSVIVVPLKTKKETLGIMAFASYNEQRKYSAEHIYILTIIASIISTTVENINLYASLEKSYFDTVRALANALDAKDSYTLGHSERVMEYATGIARIMGVEGDKLKKLRFGALLHDIGKIGIKGDIIRKQGGLSEEEYNNIKEHPIIGEKIVSNIEFLEDVIPLIKYHHEKLDGSGYPFGIKGDDIPLEARILHMADAYDAMTSDRPYRRALTPKEAISEIEKNLDTQFDRNVYKAFLKYLQEQGIDI